MGSCLNTIYYYTKPINQVNQDDIVFEKRKRELLKDLSVNIVEVKIPKKNGKADYETQWLEIIRLMSAD